MNVKIVNLSFTVIGRVQLDMDRALEDPWWEQYTRNLDLDDPIQFQQAVSNYVSAYLAKENLLSEAPFTCGPADVYNINIEVRNGGSNNATDEYTAGV